jgi:uncharacterized protein YecE (DUF72 family)
MDFGQLSPQTPFVKELAPLTREDLLLLERLSQDEEAPSTEMRLGAPQWTVQKWKGSVYPEKAKSSDLLEFFSRQWNSIELNSSYYTVPSSAQVRSWKGKTPSDFRFYVKVHQDLSHDLSVWLDTPTRTQRIRAFTHAWSHLEDRWAGSFLQLHPSFPIDRVGDLERWIEDWRTHGLEASLNGTLPRLHVEFRHPSWFQNRRLSQRAVDLLTRFDCGAVCTDTAGRRDVSHATLTSSSWLIRFLAQSTENHEQPLAVDLERLEKWSLRLAELSKRGLSEFAFFVHTPEDRWVPELSQEFERLLRERLTPDSPPESFRSPRFVSPPEPEPDLFSLG